MPDLTLMSLIGFIIKNNCINFATIPIVIGTNAQSFTKNKLPLQSSGGLLLRGHPQSQNGCLYINHKLVKTKSL